MNTHTHESTSWSSFSSPEVNVITIATRVSLAIIHIYSEKLQRTPHLPQRTHLPTQNSSFYRNLLFDTSMDLSASCRSIWGTSNHSPECSTHTKAHFLIRPLYDRRDMLIRSSFRGSPVEQFSCKLNRSESRTPLTALSHPVTGSSTKLTDVSLKGL